MRVLLIIALSFALTACATTQSAPTSPTSNMDSEVKDMREQAVDEFNVYECIMQGKAVVAAGMHGMPACIDIYSDGGKVCSDSSECEGRCTTREVVEAGARISGVCQGSGLDRFGCYNQISNGVARPAICVD